MAYPQDIPQVSNKCMSQLGDPHHLQNWGPPQHPTLSGTAAAVNEEVAIRIWVHFISVPKLYPMRPQLPLCDAPHMVRGVYRPILVHDVLHGNNDICIHVTYSITSFKRGYAALKY